MQPKQIPNILSLSRIGFSVILPFIAGNPFLFLSVYLLAGITDVADGYIARKYVWTSRMGALLDSLADTIFYLILLFILWLRFALVITNNWPWITAVLLVKISSMVISVIRFRKVVFIHTLANKFFGLCGFFVIPLVFFNIPGSIITAFFITTLLPATEEFLILITTEKPDPNKKSIFR
jgi:CDP-diacylglycerol--glycerol-3-phosphate 3-phosphatidyltransferase